MFTRVRESLKSRSLKRRSSHRLRAQVGGAGFSTLDSWNNTDLPESLQFLTNPNWINGADVIKNYILATEHQDDLFSIALKKIYASFSISDNATEIEIIRRVKANLGVDWKPYLEQVRDIFYKKEISDNDDCKINKIIKTEKIVDLLLNPMRVRNCFIEELAKILIIQKNIPSILSVISNETTTIKSDLINTRALRYLADTEKSVYNTTSEEVRDGFYMSQQSSTFISQLGVHNKAENTFWKEFVTGCITPPAIAAGNNRFITFGKLAAFMYSLYKTSSADELKLKVIQGLCSKLTNISSYQHGFSEAQLNEIVIGDFTLRNILANITVGQLQFIVHLIATIKQIETNEEIMGAINASAAEALAESSTGTA